MKKYQKGFTLGELLITIAIMGILGVTALVSTKNIKEATRIKTVYIAASSVIAAGNGCMEDKKPLSETSGVPVAGQPLCDGAHDVWPDLSDSEWEWHHLTNNAFNNTFEAYAVDTKTDAVGCIKCTVFACAKDLTTTCPAP